jgi:chromosome segregation ATPase
MSDGKPREYQDSEGKPIGLLRLVKMEPEWACNQIRHRDQLESERDALQARVSELESEAEANAWKYNPAMAEAKMEQDAKRIDELQARVNRLEEALAAADKYLVEIQADDSDYDTWICNTADARTAYAFAKQAAKESKP